MNSQKGEKNLESSYMLFNIVVYVYIFAFSLYSSLNIFIVFAMHELRGNLYNFISFVIIKKGEIVGSKAHHSSFDDDKLMIIVLVILCSFSFRYLIKILVSVQLQQNIRSQILKLACVDSRTRASRSHQVFKEESSSWIKVWTKSLWRRRFSREDFQDLSLCL